MKYSLLISIFFSASVASAAGPRFWIEPFVSHTAVSNYEEGSDEGDGTGYAGGLQVFGFFTQNLYLGLMGRYEALDYDMDAAASITNVESTTLAAGPLLGYFTNRFRFWASYLVLDKFKQEHVTVASSANTEVEKTGKGFVVGAGFWVWPNMVIGVEYLQHTYDEFDQTLPTASSGTLTNDLKISQVAVNLQFPFEL